MTELVVVQIAKALTHEMRRFEKSSFPRSELVSFYLTIELTHTQRLRSLRFGNKRKETHTEEEVEKRPFCNVKWKNAPTTFFRGEKKKSKKDRHRWTFVHIDK